MVRSNRSISNEEKKEIMLSIMDEIDSYCREHNLVYFLVGGTLLGAIRHKGFIPWDDDMDIGLPRKDYEKLIKEFVSPSGLVEISDYRNKKNYKWAGAKAYDNRTVLIELNDKKNTTGVFIDVFPFDGIVGNKISAIKEAQKKIVWKNILTIKHLKINCNRPLYKNLLIILGKIMYIIPDKFLIYMINSSYKKPISFYECDYVCNFSGAWGIREVTSSKNFKTTIESDFEGRKYKIPVGYDDYLRTVYGDYMSPPPIEKQVSHHDSVAYWKEK